MIIHNPVITGSLEVNGSPVTSIGDLDNLSGSIAALNNATSSYLQNTTDTLTGDLTVTGTLTAQEFHTEYISGSIIYESGSTKFGDSIDDYHEFTGSINLSGSLSYGGSGLVIKGTSSDTADNQTFFIAAGGGTSDTRGAYIWGRGNEATNGGRIQINAGNTATGDIQLYTGGSLRMHITSSGNIGIGTTPTYAKLTVAASDHQAFAITRNGTVVPALFLGNDGGNTARISANNANLQIGRDLNDAFTPYLSIQNGTGNVGIGTITPSALLHLRADAPYIYLDDTSTTGTKTRFQVVMGDVGSTQSSIFSFNDTSGTSLLDVMTLNESGQVGIGTTAPDLKLHLAHSDSNNGLLLEHLSQASGYQFLLNARETEGLIFQRWANGAFSTNVMTLTYDGNVGVGTSSPGDKLHIKVSSGDAGLRLEAATQTLRLDQNSIRTSTNSSLAIFTNNTVTNGVYIEAGGDVGIGTNNPGYKCDVYTGSSGVVLNLNSTNAYNAETGILFSQGRAKISGFLNGSGGTPGSSLRFYTMPDNGSITERMRVDSNGVLQLTESSANAYINANGTDFELDVNRNPETGVFSDTAKGHARIAMRAEDSGAGSRVIVSTASANNTVATERVRIHSNGALTKPYNPAWWGYTSTANSTATDGSYNFEITGLTELFDKGNNFNPSTGTFTAPVAGIYFISVNIEFDGGIANSDWVGATITVNGSQYNHDYNAPGASSSAWSDWGPPSMNNSFLVSLSANDYVRMSIDSWNGTGRTYRAGWGGHLVG